jgi:hypothetical protein
VRPLLAIAGLLVLAGAGAAGAAKPTAHTLRKSTNGPIAAIATDGGLVAWLTSGGTKECNLVHVLSPGKRDRSLPQPSSTSTTCNWSLTDGQPQLAVAGKMSTALWTLHQSGPAPFDWVFAAPIGGPEREVDKLSRASDGTGDWLGGVAGGGKTLAYSWDDVEYVDKIGCLTGGSCKEKIADGGIRIVTPSGYQELPNVKPALQLAASSGRIAYIPATSVRGGRPSSNVNGLIYVVDATSGNLVSHAYVHGLPGAIALSRDVLAVITVGGRRDRISWFSSTGGWLGSVLVSPNASPQLAVNNQFIVYRVGRVLHSISIQNKRIRTLAKAGSGIVAFALAHGQLVWSENRTDGTGRLRALAVG